MHQTIHPHRSAPPHTPASAVPDRQHRMHPEDLRALMAGMIAARTYDALSPTLGGGKAVAVADALLAVLACTAKPETDKWPQEALDRIEWWTARCADHQAHAEKAEARVAELERELKDVERWEIGFRNIVTRLEGPTAVFDIPRIVDKVSAMKDRLMVIDDDLQDHIVIEDSENPGALRHRVQGTKRGLELLKAEGAKEERERIIGILLGADEDLTQYRIIKGYGMDARQLGHGEVRSILEPNP